MFALSFSIFTLAVAILFASIQPAKAETTRTAVCDTNMSVKAMEKAMNQMLADGKTDFISTGGLVCGW